MRYRIGVFFIVTILVITNLFQFIKNHDYKEAIKGNVSSIHGTYQLITESPKQTHLTIDEDSDIYFHFSDSDKLIQSGTLEKGAYYILYKDGTENVYGKIIKSYSKIFFIDEFFNITAYDRFMDELLLPAKQEHLE